MSIQKKSQTRRKKANPERKRTTFIKGHNNLKKSVYYYNLGQWDKMVIREL